MEFTNNREANKFVRPVFRKGWELKSTYRKISASATQRCLYSRREFGKLALAGVPAAAVLGAGGVLFGAFAQAKPNSLIDGVQIGTITYSYRSMPDQSAEATLKYILDSGISAVELMGGPVESFAGAPTAPRRRRRRRRARRRAGGGRGRGGAPAEIPPGAQTGKWRAT